MSELVLELLSALPMSAAPALEPVLALAASVVAGVEPLFGFAGSVGPVEGVFGEAVDGFAGVLLAPASGMASVLAVGGVSPGFARSVVASADGGAGTGFGPELVLPTSEVSGDPEVAPVLGFAPSVPAPGFVLSVLADGFVLSVPADGFVLSALADGPVVPDVSDEVEGVTARVVSADADEAGDGALELDCEVEPGCEATPG